MKHFAALYSRIVLLLGTSLATLPLHAGGTNAAAPVRLALGDVILRAAEMNMQVRQAQERMRETEGSFKVERSKLLPKLYGSASQKRQDRSTAAFGLPEFSAATVPEPIPFNIDYPGLSPSVINRYNLPTEGVTRFSDPFRIEYDHSESTGAYDFFDAKLFLGMPLFDREQYEKYKVARQSISQSELEIDWHREEAMSLAAQLFYAVLVQQKSIEALEGKIDLHKDKLEETKDLLATGTARPIDVKKEMVALAGAENSLLEATKRRAAAMRELKRQINLEPSDELVLLGDLFYQDVTLPEPSAALKQAMDKRIDIQLQQKREIAADMQRDAASYARYPELRGMGSYGRQGNNIDDTVDAWMIGIMASVPIWDSFERRGKIEMRESQYQQARYETEDLANAVEAELDLLRDEVMFTAASVRLLEQSVEYLEENRQYLEDKVTAGTGKRIDLLAAEVDLAQAEYKLIEAVFNHEIMRVKWLKSIGSIEEVAAIPEP
jgi:outer membrane protein TolC